MSGLEQTANTLLASLDESSFLAENAGKLANEIEAIKQKTVGKLAEIAAQAGMASAGSPPVGGIVGGTTATGGSAGSAGRTLGGQLVSGPAAGMSNTTRGGLLNESLKLDESLMQIPELNWPAPGAKGSHTDTTIGSTRGFEPVSEGVAAQPNETMQATQKPASTERLEERRESLKAPFFAEAIETGVTIGGGTEPLMMWLIYDFGIGNADPDYDNNSKSPLAIQRQLSERMKYLVNDLNLWVDLEVYGYTDDYGTDEQNTKLREERAIAAVDWFVPRLEDQREDWIDTMTGEIISSPINVTMIRGQPLDKFITDNSTPAGRARNRSVLIVEKQVHSVKPSEDFWAMPDELEAKKQEIKERIDEIRDSTHPYDRYKKIAYDTWLNPHADMRAIDYQRFIDMLPAVNSLPGSKKIDFFRFTADYRHELDTMLKSATTDSVSIIQKLSEIYYEIDRVEAEMVKYRMFDRGGLNPDSWIKKFDKWTLQQMKTPNTLYSAYAAEFPEP